MNLCNTEPRTDSPREREESEAMLELLLARGKKHLAEWKPEKEVRRIKDYIETAEELLNTFHERSGKSGDGGKFTMVCDRLSRRFIYVVASAAYSVNPNCSSLPA